MFSYLNSPSSYPLGQKENLWISIFIGLFVVAFLSIFQPFGISGHDFSYIVLVNTGFGLVSFLALMVFYFVVPKLLPGYFEEKNYTLRKDMLAHVVLLLAMGLINRIYSDFVFSDTALQNINLTKMIGQTFLVGVFPITFLSLLQHARSNKLNVEASRDIILSKEKTSTVLQSKKALFLTISTEQEEITVNMNDLLYLESNGNYVMLNHLKEGALTKSMHRVTLKSVESENTYKNIIRCHRSYVVNLDQVMDIQGNAQGLRLKLNDCDETVPVSRKYISTVKDYFSQ